VRYDLVDRRCVVTGASSGIGKEIARNLAYFGATVVMACRDRTKGGAALEEIVADSGNDRISLMIVDLSSLASIRAFAKNLVAGGSPVHVLVNNAACVAHVRRTSVDGMELTWATNVLAYFALTNLLVPSLRKSAPARVVHVASTYARGLDLGDVQFEKRRYSGLRAYAQSKQADRMIAWRLAGLLPAAEVSVHACHPGLVASGLYREQGGWLRRMLGLGSWLMKTEREGALTPTFIAAEPDVQSPSGRFWIDQAPVECEFAKRPDDIRALWRLCADMTKTDAF
jgi:NAD(P)-dependent dehydrogenase (short-subunit alcohol dehydrogenase family)